MALPIVPVPMGKVKVGDVEVEVRGLARAEVHLVGQYAGNPVEGEAFLLSVGAGVTLDEAKAWLASVPNSAADALLTKIMELSGLDDLGKESPEA
jgi:hypothetical protein